MRTTQLASGFLTHLLMALALLSLLHSSESPPTPARSFTSLIWTGPATQGGGGGRPEGRSSPIARRSTRANTDAQFRLPATAPVLAALELPGIVAVLSAADSPGISADDGDGGSGTRGGPGAGVNVGPGAGPGDGAFEAGSPGLTDPVLIAERTPEYTTAAMRAKVQGTVLLEATVVADGTVGHVRVIRSLDEQFGLDQKAIEAVRNWKFRPGTRVGKAVAVTVLIELTFTLR